MDAALAKEELNARMLLQVHDELVFELPTTRSPEPCGVKKVMEHARCRRSIYRAARRRRPRGDNWDEAH